MGCGIYTNVSSDVAVHAHICFHRPNKYSHEYEIHLEYFFFEFNDHESVFVCD